MKTLVSVLKTSQMELSVSNKNEYKYRTLLMRISYVYTKSGVSGQLFTAIKVMHDKNNRVV